MARTATTSGKTGDAGQADRPIVVGVDGSPKNRAAVSWAIAEAERTNKSLQLLTVADKQDIEPPPYAVTPLPPGPVDRAYGSLESRATTIRRAHPDLDVTTDVLIDDARRGLVVASKHAQMMVVGQRGLGRFKRMMLGSTSIELAGRSAVPVVVVPGSWKADDAQGRPVVVGIDIDRDCNALLEFAFRRAGELQVPLIAVHVWDAHPSVTLTSADRQAWAEEVEKVVATLIAICERTFPDVEALAAQRRGHPAQGLLESVENAQLLVLGRHEEARPHLGLGIGSVARTVLHYAKLPVAVVPTS